MQSRKFAGRFRVETSVCAYGVDRDTTAPSAIWGHKSTHRHPRTTHRPPSSANKVRTVGLRVRTDVKKYAPTAISAQESTHRRSRTTHRPRFRANKVRTVRENHAPTAISAQESTHRLPSSANKVRTVVLKVRTVGEQTTHRCATHQAVPKPTAHNINVPPIPSEAREGHPRCCFAKSTTRAWRPGP